MDYVHFPETLTQQQWFTIGTLRANGVAWDVVSKSTELPEEQLAMLPISDPPTYRRWLNTAHEIVVAEALGETLLQLRKALRSDNERSRIQAATTLTRFYMNRHPVPKPTKADQPKPYTPWEEKFYKDAAFYSSMTPQKYEEFKMVQTRHEFCGILSTLLHEHPDLEEEVLTKLKLSTMGHADGFALETKEREAYQEHIDNVFKGKTRVPAFFPHTAAKQHAAAEARQAALDGQPLPPPGGAVKNGLLMAVLLFIGLWGSWLGRGTAPTGTEPVALVEQSHAPNPEIRMAATEPITLAMMRAAFSSAVVCDALDSEGYTHQSPRLPLRPLTTDGVLIGRCKTTLWADMAHPDPKPYELELAAVDSCQPDDVLIAAASGSVRSGIWGELLSTAARNTGCVGVIVDGAVRDVRQMRAMGFPCFALGTIIYDSKDRQRVIDYDVPVEIDGVRFAPGDLVVADADGVVVVPQAIEAVIVQKAWAKVHAENEVRDAIRAGMKATAAFHKYGVL